MAASLIGLPGVTSAQTVPFASSEPAATATAIRLDELEKAVTQMSRAGSHGARQNGLPLHGFASIGWSKIRQAPAGTRDGAALGSIDFYLTPAFASQVKALIELNIETGDSGASVVDLKRAQIGFAFSDALTLWAGRFHTPFGHWNLAFHHGAQLQTSIRRPRLLDFEDDGGILPVHTVGAMGVSAIRLGAGKLGYRVFGGNATRIAAGVLNPNAGGGDGGSQLLGFSAEYRFGAGLDALTLGVHGLRQRISVYDAAQAPLGATQMRMLGGFAVYDDGGWELIGEVYHFRNTDAGGVAGAQTSWAGYAQPGRLFQERWMPYVRVERAFLSTADSYFAALANGRSYTRQLAGLRFNIGGALVLPIDNAAAQAEFLAKVVKLPRNRFAAWWTKKAFRDGQNAPRTLDTDAEVIAFVTRQRGAIGYVTAAPRKSFVIAKF